MYLPDADRGLPGRGARRTCVTANEGDARDYDGSRRGVRVSDRHARPDRVPRRGARSSDERQPRAACASPTPTGDTDGDGDFDAALRASAAARSRSGRRDGALVFDSGDELERAHRRALRPDFNTDNAANGSCDTRSDDKGPEPEGVSSASVGGAPTPSSASSASAASWSTT